MQLQQGGRLPEAEQICQQVLTVDAANAEAWHQLGAIAYQTSNLERALACWQRAVELAPLSPQTHNNLGVTFERLGRLDEAAASYRRALELRPDFIEAHNGMGIVCKRQGTTAEAALWYRRAIELNPNYANAHNNLGNLLCEQEKWDEAAAHFQRALELTPNLAEGYNNLANVRKKQGRLDDATALYQQAIALRPDFADPYSNLGVIFQDQGKLDEAIAQGCQAVQLNARNFEAHNSLGVSYQLQGKLDEAAACYRRAIALNPVYAEAHNNLGAVLQSQGRFDEAARSCGEALRINPGFAEAHYNRAVQLLLHGDFERGLPEYEWRWKCKNFDRRVLVGRQWDGRRLADGMLLMHAEQGLGDTLQFIRYASLAKERVNKAGLLCLPRLMPLLSRCPGIDEFFSIDEPSPPAITEVALMSLPWVLGTTLNTIPQDVPYLFSDPALVEKWRDRLPNANFKIGIVWQGNPTFRGDKTRSIPLAQFAPVANVPTVQLIGLQQGAGTEQIPKVRELFSVTQLGSGIDEAGAFIDTAAIMMNLDLVITSDTAIAHLAGGLGVPVWLALRFIPEWRWFLDRSDSPWYPTMRLFRQKKAGNWAGVFKEMREALEEQSRGRGGSGQSR